MVDRSPEALLAASTSKLESARGIAAKAEADGRDFTEPERALVKSLLDEATALKEQRADLIGSVALNDAIDDLGRGFPRPQFKSSGGRTMTSTLTKSIGELVADDAGLKGWLKSVAGPEGIGTKGISVGNSPPVRLGVGFKDILAGSDPTGAGALVTPDFRGLIDPTGTQQRPLTLRQLLTQGNTTSDTVSYARVVGFTNNAAPTPEATGTSAGDGTADVTGTKPESALEFEQITETVKTIPHWIPASKRAMADAAQLRTTVDNFLGYGIAEELEDQIVNGNGTDENFEGILNVSGVQELDAADVTAIDADASGALAGIVAIRIARRLVRTNGRAQATAILINPADNEVLDLARDENGQFYLNSSPANTGAATVAGLPRVESEAVPEGTCIVGDWRMATLWDREQLQVLISDSHADFFIRNLVAILAEVRVAFGVVRPAAFVAVDLESIFAISS